MRCVYLVAVAIVCLGLTNLVGADLAVAGEPISGSIGVLASNCFNCHGTDGKATAAIPALAGREKADLIEALQTYKDGTREATIMHQLAKGYTDDELVALGVFFSRLPAE
jgi:cytochrome c553